MTSTPKAATSTLALQLQSCHSHNWLETRSQAGNAGATYVASTTYPAYDPYFPTWFASSAVYGNASWGTGSDPTADSCNSRSKTAGSGCSWSGCKLTERQRCQQCVDEAGYFIASTADLNTTGNEILFKGNWLNFYPPKINLARKVLTDFIQTNASSTLSSNQARIGVIKYGGWVSDGLVPNCGSTWTTSTANALVAAVNTLDASGGTPLCDTYVKAANYLAGSSGHDGVEPGTPFASLPSFAVKSGAPTAGFTSNHAALNRARCSACQPAAIVLITDGQPTTDEHQSATSPGAGCADGTKGAGTSCRQLADKLTVLNGGSYKTCPTPGDCNDGNLPGVAYMLFHNDLNPDNGTQKIETYTIGLGIDSPLLRTTASNGGGFFSSATDANELTDAISGALQAIIAHRTSFSTAAVQTVQVGNNSSAFIPRFLPGTNNMWEGHLFRFRLWDQFATGLAPDGTPTTTDAVLVIDKNNAIVTQDSEGNFLVNNSTSTAVPYWDAGDVLQAMTSTLRTIYTAIPATTDPYGNVLSWKRVPFIAGSSTELLPYLGVEYSTSTNSTCGKIFGYMSPAPAVKTLDACAKAIINYARGMNVLGDNPSASSTANRQHVMGDIFHSSPVLVDPPVDQYLCTLGLHSQCLSTLYHDDPNVQTLFNLPAGFATQSATYPTAGFMTNPNGSLNPGDAYEKYWQTYNGTHARQRLLIVGTNDGMVHAFDAGVPTSTAQDPSSNFRSVGYTFGTGQELWAFIPPDQLPRLWLLIANGQGHQYFMDGDAMVRDIWVHGSGSSTDATQGKKQWDEFHTIAILAEREGGNHRFALDVTSSTNPQFLWMWPKPCTIEELTWGQSWGSVAPHPPPIGPVLMQSAVGTFPMRYGVPTVEKWVVVLNGGHDPYGTRGQNFAVLDAWTGQPYYKAGLTGDANTVTDANMSYGFPGTASLVDYGVSSTQYQPDGFFDTAVLGDEGEQIWTLRMASPGHLNASGYVDNWTFARAFDADKTSSSVVKRYPIYSAPALTIQPDTMWLRAYVGGGDRAQLRSSGGGSCGVDRLGYCAKASCTVSAMVGLVEGGLAVTSTFSASGGSYGAISTAVQTAGSAYSCQSAGASLTATSTGCSQSFSQSGAGSAFTCDGTTTSTFSCSGGPMPDPLDLAVVDTTNSVGDFISTVIFGKPTSPTTVPLYMDGPGDKATYDGLRVSRSQLKDVSTSTVVLGTANGPQATTQSIGFVLRYSNLDEKSVNSPNLLGGCVLWTSFTPTSTTSATSTCGSAGTGFTSTYQADPITGLPNCAEGFITATSTAGSTYQRSIALASSAAPPAPTAAVAIAGSGGAYKLSTLLLQPNAAAVTQYSMTTNNEVLQLLYSLPLTVDQHKCRHVSAANCP